MSNKLLSLVLLLCSSSAFAGWKQTGVLFEVKDANDHRKIADALRAGREVRELLLGEDLPSASKLVVTNLSVTITEFQWENDSSCKVPNPETVNPEVLENSNAAYYFAANPSRKYKIATDSRLPNPCATRSNPGSRN